MGDTLKNLLADLRKSLIAYESFVDGVSEENEEVFLKVNCRKNSNTILSDTFHKNGFRPLDTLNYLEGYLSAKLKQPKQEG